MDGDMTPQEDLETPASGKVPARFSPYDFSQETPFFKRLGDLAPARRWLSGQVALRDVLRTEKPAQTALCPQKSAVLYSAAQGLSLSPAARRMLHEAAEDGWSVSLETLDGPDFHLDVPEKLIVLDDGGLEAGMLLRSDYFRNTLLVCFIRALRDVWQEKRHGAFSENYGPEAVLFLERVRAADLDVLAVLVAWELRSEDAGTANASGASLWRHLIGSADGDLALRFSTHLEREPSAAYSGRALKAAFAQWFADPARVNACDHETLNMMDQMLQERCDHNPYASLFGDKLLTPVGIEVLSCLPDKTAYLQGCGVDMLRNPIYAGLGDMINQSHLLQIVHDLSAVWVQGIPFRDSMLAVRMFPGGVFTPEPEELPK